jgi:hypothetical protein
MFAAPGVALNEVDQTVRSDQQLAEARQPGVGKAMAAVCELLERMGGIYCQLSQAGGVRFGIPG